VDPAGLSGPRDGPGGPRGLGGDCGDLHAVPGVGGGSGGSPARAERRPPADDHPDDVGPPRGSRRARRGDPRAVRGCSEPGGGRPAGPGGAGLRGGAGRPPASGAALPAGSSALGAAVEGAGGGPGPGTGAAAAEPLRLDPHPAGNDGGGRGVLGPGADHCRSYRPVAPCGDGLQSEGLPTGPAGGLPWGSGLAGQGPAAGPSGTGDGLEHHLGADLSGLSGPASPPAGGGPGAIPERAHVAQGPFRGCGPIG
jgi:hypothetical protein